MKQIEIDNLKIGDLVLNKSGKEYKLIKIVENRIRDKWGIFDAYVLEPQFGKTLENYDRNKYVKKQTVKSGYTLK